MEGREVLFKDKRKKIAKLLNVVFWIVLIGTIVNALMV